MPLLMKGDTFTLTPLEQRIARYLAEAREKSNIDAGHVRPVWSKGRDGVEQNLMGAGAELVFARAQNIYPDLTTHLRVGGEDSTLHTMDRVDAKATPYVDRPLLVASIRKRRSDADVYVLFTCAGSTYVFVGWAPADRLLASIKDLGYGPSYVLEPHELEEGLLTP